MNTTKRISIAAGIGYLIIFISGIYANFFVLEELADPTNPGLTLQNLQMNAGSFKTGIFSFLVMVLADIVLAWALYILFKPRNKKLALFTAWFRLLNCLLFGAALVHLLDIQQLVSNELYSSLGKDQLGLEVMRSLSAFNNTWLLGLVLFGVHLVSLGILIFRISRTTRIISILLAIAGFGYLADSCAQFFLSDYESYADFFAMAVILPGVVGELALTFWLLFGSGCSKEDYSESTQLSTLNI